MRWKLNLLQVEQIGFDVKSSFNLETVLTLWLSSKYYFGVLEFKFKTHFFTCFIFISILGTQSSKVVTIYNLCQKMITIRPNYHCFITLTSMLIMDVGDEVCS